MTLEISPESRVQSRCSWETYERLLSENENASAPRFTFDQGWLEIMCPSIEHERVNDALKLLVTAMARHFGLDRLGTGSATFRRQDVQRGFEPDSSYYFQHAAAMRNVSEVDLSLHPPPELVIEIDLSRSSYSKLEIYRTLGVPEVWRWAKNKLVFYVLEQSAYHETNHSRTFPQISSEALTGQVHSSAELSDGAWDQAVQQWLKSM